MQVSLEGQKYTGIRCRQQRYDSGHQHPLNCTLCKAELSQNVNYISKKINASGQAGKKAKKPSCITTTLTQSGTHYSATPTEPSPPPTLRELSSHVSPSRLWHCWLPADVPRQRKSGPDPVTSRTSQVPCRVSASQHSDAAAAGPLAASLSNLSPPASFPLPWPRGQFPVPRPQLQV